MSSNEGNMTPERADEIIADFSSRHSYSLGTCLFVRKLRERGIPDTSIAAFLEELDEICLDCFNHDHPCYCMRDD